VIEGFDKNTDLGQIAAKLKSKLACGGAAKEGHVELQGDHRRVIKDILSGLGFPESAIVIDWANR